MNTSPFFMDERTYSDWLAGKGLGLLERKKNIENRRIHLLIEEANSFEEVRDVLRAMADLKFPCQLT